jgi:penicillin-binding protein 2
MADGRMNGGSAMDPPHLQVRRGRARSALGLALLGLGLLLLAIFREQLVHGPVQQASPGARVRAHVVPATRGLILDRHGAVLAETTRGYALFLAPVSSDSAGRALHRLAPYLELSEQDVGALLARQSRRPRERLMISPDVPVDVVTRIVERRPELDGVVIEPWPKRHYPAGPVAAHVVGTVGPVADRERARTPHGARGSHRLSGKTGLERRYDRQLAGREGLRYEELDERGLGIRPIRLRREVPAVPGETLRVSLDLGLQQVIADAIPRGTKAAVAALDPRTGEVLALYSSPTFDPNQVAGPAFRESWTALLEAEGEPGLARAVAGSYQPGSAWGITMALVAVRLGIAGPETAMPLPCRGGLSYANRYLQCSDPHGHGSLTLREALAHGCHVYFYQLGLKVGLDRLLAEGTRLGFGRPTGVDLPEERSGLVLSDRATYARSLGVAPAEHEAMLIAAGQGLIEVSPLKMAHFVAALITNGPVPAPRLLADEGWEGRAGALELSLGAGEREWLRAELAARSTASAAPGRSAGGARAAVIGHDWFVGMGERPASRAELVVVVVVEGSGAGPAAARIGELILDRFRRDVAGARTGPVAGGWGSRRGRQQR